MSCQCAVKNPYRKYEEPSSPKEMLMHEANPLFRVVFYNLNKMKSIFFFKDCRSTSTNDYLKGKKYEKVIFLLFSFPFFFSFLFYLNFLFIIWYQIHFKSILTSVWWTYQVTCYRTVIESPIIYCPSHEL